MSSPSDHAWNGHPRGACGASPSAISNRWSTLAVPTSAARIGTGISFLPVTAEGLAAAIRRTLALWSDQPGWKRVQSRAMTVDVSWKEPAKEYAALYADLTKSSSARG